MVHQNENEMPLKSVQQNEEDGEAGRSNDGIATVNRRQNRKLFNSMKWLRIISIVLVFIIAVLLVAYFIYTNLLRGGLKHHPQAQEKTANGLVPPNPEVKIPPSMSTLHVFEKSAVCSDSDICSKLGRDIFHRGGNVVDSALATLLCNGITTMQSLGIGGGFLMNVFIKSENRAYTIDAREVAPIAATEDMFNGKDDMDSMQGPLSIIVPGEVMGYHEAHKRFASMTWKELIEPSIKICEDGIEMTQHMFDSLNTNKENVQKDPHLRATFVNATTGEFHKIGTEVFPAKELCQTYRLLAANGPTDFYNGTLAKMIAEDLEEIGSLVTLDDLSVYRADVVSSISVPLNDNVVHVVPPVGSGTIVGLILNILQGYNFTSASISNANETALTYHRIAEAFKFGFAKRWELGDVRFTDLRMMLRNITTPEYGEDIRKQIDDTKTYNDPLHYGAKFSFKNENGTSHISIIAPNGDALAVTSSINFYFGCGHTGKRTGIVFNSGIDDFAFPGKTNYFGIPPAKPNYIRPQKRAMSSQAPTIVTDMDGNVKVVIGSAGGTKIISSVVFIIARLLWFGEDIKQATDAARFHHQLLPNVLEYEYGVLEDIVKSLEAKGHVTKRYRERASVVCGLSKNATAIYANSDYRKKGGVAGF